MSKLSHAHPLALMHELASLAENMGGSSGGIYSILLTSAGRAFQDQVGGEVKPDAWVRALKYGLEAVMKYGGAAPGDRTMVSRFSFSDEKPDQVRTGQVKSGQLSERSLECV